jgi:hypothetical protein
MRIEGTLTNGTTIAGMGFITPNCNNRTNNPGPRRPRFADKSKIIDYRKTRSGPGGIET